MKKVRVRVPATSANLGPGYDVLGVALTLYNELELEARWEGAWNEPSLIIEVSGEGEDHLPRDPRNIAAQAAFAVFKRAGRKPHSLKIRQTNRIPLASGLGSSAAACVASLVAANALSGHQLSQRELIDLATELEGHPDNAVPALIGGLCISVKGKEGLLYDKLPWPRDLMAVVCIPEMSAKLMMAFTDARYKTHTMRTLVRSKVELHNVVFNIGRTALLVAALTKGPLSLLSEAMQDRVHQPARFDYWKGSEEAIVKAQEAGAHGAALSGAGPGILALSPKATARKVAAAMENSFKKLRRHARTFVLSCDPRGAQVIG